MENGLDNYFRNGKKTDKGRILVSKILDSGGFENYMQEMRVEYLEGIGNLTPKVILAISNTNPSERTPRSFRTADAGTLRSIISSLVKCLERLEKDRGR